MIVLFFFRPTGIKNCPQIEKKLTNYYNKVLLVDKRNSRLVSCGTLFQVSCSFLIIIFYNICNKM